VSTRPSALPAALAAALLCAAATAASAKRPDEPAPAPTPVIAEPTPEPAEQEPVPALPAAPAEATQNAEQSQGYTPDAASLQSPLRLSGYIDAGWARATGDGSSFKQGDTVLPADYGVDTFAPAVNSRGDVASNSSGGLFTNGFLPRSIGLGGHAGAFLSTVDVDVQYAPTTVPLLGFVRLQVLPRFSAAGDQTRIVAQQAFVRVLPFHTQEMALNIGKSDSVFGIEYLENEANLRTGITPSLVARYTTGQGLGAKLFYRVQLVPLWSAVSLHVSGTANGTLVETLSPDSVSNTGRPIWSGRLGYELKLPRFELKLGGSGSHGPRNDQHDPNVQQTLYGLDLRVFTGPLELRGEYVHMDQDEGGGDKINGNGPQTVVSGFSVTGGYAQAGLGFDLDLGPFKRVTVYGRYDRRHAQFKGFRAITVDRVTAGVRCDLGEQVSLKGEGLINRELEGAPDVPNDVLTTSLVLVF
jgi:hypothetical protein